MGFIGCNFVRCLPRSGREAQIVNLDALTYAGSLDNLQDLPDPSRHQFVKGDICDRTLVDQLLRVHRIDTAVHFAAESYADRSITGQGAFVQTDADATYTLLQSCRQYWQKALNRDAAMCRFHHISIDEVYGTLAAQDPPFSETTPYAPNSAHSARIDAVLRGGRLEESCKIGGGNEQSNIDIVRRAHRLMDELGPQGAPHDKLINLVTDHPGHDWHCAIDASKLTCELGWKRTERFEEEMRGTIVKVLKNAL